jgi:hypothetical protein
MGHRRRLRSVGMAVALLAFAVLPASARHAVRIGAGVFGVHAIPLYQEDAGPGPMYGWKLKMIVPGHLALEGFFTKWEEGDMAFALPLGTQTLEGSTDQVYGLDLVIGSSARSGLGLYLAAGAGYYTLTKASRSPINAVGPNAGLGLEFRSSKGLAIDLSGRLHLVPMPGGGNREYGGLQAGVNYYFRR